MLHCFLATENRNIVNFRQLSRFRFLIILSRSKMVDPLLVSYCMHKRCQTSLLFAEVFLVFPQCFLLLVSYVKVID